MFSVNDYANFSFAFNDRILRLLIEGDSYVPLNSSILVVLYLQIKAHFLQGIPYIQNCGNSKRSKESKLKRSKP